MRRRAPRDDCGPPTRAQVSVLIDDETEDDDRAHATPADALAFIAVRKGAVPALCHALAGGALLALGAQACSLRAAEAAIGPAGPILLLFWWPHIWLALLPLLLARSAVTAGTNVASFDTSDGSGLARASRALYALGACALIGAGGPVGVGAGTALLVSLLLLWPAGTLPHARVLCAWLAEQWLVHAHGGSPCASDARTALSIALGLGGALAVAIGAVGGGALEVVLACALGHLLALPLPPVHGAAVPPTAPPPASVSAPAETGVAARARLTPPPAARRAGATLDWVLAVGVGGGGALGLASAHASITEPGARAVITAVPEVLLLGLWAAHALSARLQRPAWARGLLRVPAAASTPAARERLRRVHRALQLPLPLCTVLVLGARLAIARGAHGAASPPPLLGGGGAAALAYAVLLGRALRWPWQAPARAALEALLIVWLHRAGAFGSAPPAGAGADAPAVAEAAPLALAQALALCAFAHDRARRFVANVHAQCVLLFGILHEPKQRFARDELVLRASKACAPLLGSVAAVAALLAAPLEPVLGLPVFVVGHPRPARFWPSARAGRAALAIDGAMGAPEPPAGPSAPIAPEPASAPTADDLAERGDAAAYSQLVDELTSVVLPLALADGSVGGGDGAGAAGGSLLLVRLDDSIAVVQVLEGGYRHATLLLRGLERVATSCHNVEGGALDALNERVLDAPQGGRAGDAAPASPRPAHRRDSDDDSDDDERARPRGGGGGGGGRSGSDAAPPESALDAEGVYAMGAYAPLARVGVHAYATANATLSGVLQSRDRLQLVSDALLFALVYAVRYKQRAAERGGGLPVEWFELIADFADPDINAASSAPKPERTAGGGSARPVPAQAAGLDDLAPPPFPHDFDAAVCARFGLDRTTTQRIAAPAEPRAKPPRTSPKVIRVVLWLHAIAERFGLHGMTAVDVGLTHVLNVFEGSLPSSLELKAMESRAPDMHRLLLRAYRHAVKLVLDVVSLYHIDDLWAPAEADAVAAELAELNNGRRWYVGPIGSEAWAAAMARRTGRLFGLKRGEGGFGAAASHSSQLLTLREEQAAVGEWSGTIVRALWASQLVELLFAANDDDERYSIQAHTRLLRNLAVQAASAPLGYPAFTSGPRLCSLRVGADDALTRACCVPEPARPQPGAAGSAAGAKGVARRRSVKPPRSSEGWSKPASGESSFDRDARRDNLSPLKAAGAASAGGPESPSVGRCAAGGDGAAIRDTVSVIEVSADRESALRTPGDHRYARPSDYRYARPSAADVTAVIPVSPAASLGGAVGDGGGGSGGAGPNSARRGSVGTVSLILTGGSSSSSVAAAGDGGAGSGAFPARPSTDPTASNAGHNGARCAGGGSTAGPDRGPDRDRISQQMMVTSVRSSLASSERLDGAPLPLPATIRPAADARGAAGPGRAAGGGSNPELPPLPPVHAAARPAPVARGNSKHEIGRMVDDLLADISATPQGPGAVRPPIGSRSSSQSSAHGVPQRSGSGVRVGSARPPPLPLARAESGTGQQPVWGQPGHVRPACPSEGGTSTAGSRSASPDTASRGGSGGSDARGGVVPIAPELGAVLADIEPREPPGAAGDGDGRHGDREAGAPPRRAAGWVGQASWEGTSVAETPSERHLRPDGPGARADGPGGSVIDGDDVDLDELFDEVEAASRADSSVP